MSGDCIMQPMKVTIKRPNVYIARVAVDSLIGGRHEQQREHGAGPQQQDTWGKVKICRLLQVLKALPNQRHHTCYTWHLMPLRCLSYWKDSSYFAMPFIPKITNPSSCMSHWSNVRSKMLRIHCYGFHIGALTTIAAQDLHSETIMRIGRWSKIEFISPTHQL